MAENADIGLVGLAVMGQNLALNMSDHGAMVAVFNRTTSKVDDFLAGPATGTSIVGTHSLAEMVASLHRPRRVLLMIQAGPPVDDMLAQLVPLLTAGDIVIDGGNSLYADTARRTAMLEDQGILYIGMGISGGEEGARHGPSIMPGGSAEAWPQVRQLFQSIAAKVEDGTPCCDWIGPGGSGHYVKMVHNGIEYGDMQVIAEAYLLMRDGLAMSPAEMSEAFRSWGAGRLDSFLIDITADILAFETAEGSPLLDEILDAAGQKGTGRWAVASALERSVPTTLIAEAVFARMVSALHDERAAASAILAGPESVPVADRGPMLAALEDALYASKIVSYAQGFMQLRSASEHYEWDLDLGRIASLWREGCIIRAAFLDDITAAFTRDPELPNLLLDPFFREALATAQDGWRRALGFAVASGIAVPAYATALAFYDGYRASRGAANLIQAQRDYFGAHTYERIDRPRGEFFHTNWTGHGGEITAGSYQG
jgi:6-phosphogluconate dehydrogenase